MYTCKRCNENSVRSAEKDVQEVIDALKEAFKKLFVAEAEQRNNKGIIGMNAEDSCDNKRCQIFTNQEMPNIYKF